MKFAKTFLLIVCACALQGCATYYYSSPPGAQRVTSSEDGYYYGSGVGYATIDYSAARYYPWWSMDYYYLGPHYYSPWYAGYASGWYASAGFNFGYPPFYYPYGYSGIFYYPAFGFGWYDPWYGWPGYRSGIHFAWYDTYWRKRYQNHARDHYANPVGSDFGNSRHRQRDLRRDVYTDPRDRAPASNAAERAAATSRNVSMSPSYRTGESGMQVRTRRDRKIEESRIGPAPVQSPSVPATRARSISVAPVSPAPAQAASPEPSRDVASPPRPPARPVHQAPPPQARPRERSRPVTAPSRDFRPAPPPRSMPSNPPPRSAPARPSPRPDRSGGRSPAHSDSESKRRN